MLLAGLGPPLAYVDRWVMEKINFLVWDMLDTWRFGGFRLVCLAPMHSWTFSYHWGLIALPIIFPSKILSGSLIDPASLLSKPFAEASPDPVPWTFWMLLGLSLVCLNLAVVLSVTAGKRGRALHYAHGQSPLPHAERCSSLGDW